MNQQTIATIQRLQDELEAILDDEFRNVGVNDLFTLSQEHIDNPMKVTALAMMKHSPQVAILAGCCLRRILLRRLEARQMEAAT
jgi:hypothetical protein